jgi:mannosyltransferase OCH1-like enzyme
MAFIEDFVFLFKFLIKDMIGIPKIIHQIMFDFKTKYPPDEITYVTPGVPERWKKSPVEWKRLHPSWNLVLWNDVLARNLIRDSYPWFLEKYDGYKYPIQRVDAIRYFILHAYGGVYSDLDLYPTRSIDSYFMHQNIEVYIAFRPFIGIGNSFIGSKKSAVFWNDVFDELLNYKPGFFIRLFKHYYVLSTTGPDMLYRVVNNYKGGVLGKLPSEFYNHENAKKDSTQILMALEGSSWASWDTKALNIICKDLKLTIGIVVFLILFIIVLLGYLALRFRTKLLNCERPNIS